MIQACLCPCWGRHAQLCDTWVWWTMKLHPAISTEDLTLNTRITGSCQKAIVLDRHITRGRFLKKIRIHVCTVFFVLSQRNYKLIFTALTSSKCLNRQNLQKARIDFDASASKRAKPCFRHYVISQLKRLEVLDDTVVTKEERKEAERIYAQCLPHVPTTFTPQAKVLPSTRRGHTGVKCVLTIILPMLWPNLQASAEEILLVHFLTSSFLYSCEDNPQSNHGQSLVAANQQSARNCNCRLWNRWKGTPPRTCKLHLMNSLNATNWTCLRWNHLNFSEIQILLLLKKLKEIRKPTEQC